MFGYCFTQFFFPVTRYKSSIWKLKHNPEIIIFSGTMSMELQEMLKKEWLGNRSLSILLPLILERCFRETPWWWLEGNQDVASTISDYRSKKPPTGKLFYVKSFFLPLWLSAIRDSEYSQNPRFINSYEKFLFQVLAENCAWVDHFPVGCSIHCQFFSPRRSKTTKVTYERFETGIRTEATAANEE